MSRRVRLTSLALGTFLFATASLVFADSHVRFVRLSLVDGQVQMERQAGQGLDRAILNTPVVEGMRVVTGPDGLAEVEFENESALRLTGDSDVTFTQLTLADNGVRTSNIAVAKGLVYLQTASKGDDAYRVIVGGKTLEVQRNSIARFDAGTDQLQVSVLKGEVRTDDGARLITVKKKETLTVDLKNAAEYTVAKNVQDLPIDRWNKEREDYRNTYASNQGYGGPDRGFGLQDLNYYGNYLYASGYGYVWQPYGFSNSLINWDPYSNGAWLFYPGAGYAWASAYPWGWLPYHYGSWAFVNGIGWAWVPGNYSGRWYSTGYVPAPRIVRAPQGWKQPTAPVVPARGVPPRTVLVGSTTPSAAIIPGGRVPPNFGSVIPGRSVRPVATGATARPVADNARHGSNGHVFAPPPQRPVSAIEPTRPSAIGASGRPVGTGPSAVGAPHATSPSAGHSGAAPHR